MRTNLMPVINTYIPPRTDSANFENNIRNHVFSNIHDVPVPADTYLRGEYDFEDMSGLKEIISAAQGRMQYGTLHFTKADWSELNPSFLSYYAVYKPHQRISILGRDFEDFRAIQDDLNRNALNTYRSLVKRNMEVKPINVALSEDEDSFILTDGHHRLAASMEAGKPVRVEISLGAENQLSWNWKEVKWIIGGYKAPDYEFDFEANPEDQKTYKNLQWIHEKMDE